MKRLYFWEWFMVLVTGLSYFGSLCMNLTQQQALLVSVSVTAVAAIVALFSFESFIVALVTFSAIGFATALIGWLSITVMVVISILLVVLAIGLTVYHLLNNEEDEHVFIVSLLAQFSVIFLTLRFGHSVWNYWQTFS